MDIINPYVSCKYARMRKDICGIYCVGEFHKKKDGSCDKYVNWRNKRRNKREYD